MTALPVSGPGWRRDYAAAGFERWRARIDPSDDVAVSGVERATPQYRQ